MLKLALESGQQLGDNDPDVSATLNSLGMLYKYTGEFDKAEPLYHRALAITEANLGKDHPEVASIYHNLGGLEHARERYAAGEQYARKSVAIREKALGPDHPHVAAEIAALAAILDGQEKFAEAEALCRQLGLGNLIDRMPTGLLQMVGESGWQLSHGEKSRLFLARAILQNAETVILDESFAALDPENLHRTMQCVFEKVPTLMVIAHP